MRRRRDGWCALSWLLAGCANAPAASDGGADQSAAASDSARAAVRVPRQAPDDVAPEDWILFQCPSCGAAASGLRAVRCDGSDELFLGAPPNVMEIAGARLIEAVVAVSVSDASGGWNLWTRRAGAWQMVALGASGNGQPKLVGGPHIDGHFSGRSAFANRIVYSRSYDSGTDTVSYYDLALRAGYDFLGQALPQVTDLQIQFSMLGDDRLATYFFSPSGRPPGNARQLNIDDVQTGTTHSMFMLDKPDQIAGMRDGSVAVLREGVVTTYHPNGTVKDTLAHPAPVTAIAAVDSGALAFSSAGDLYCARSPTDIVRLTDSPTEEQLFP